MIKDGPIWCEVCRKWLKDRLAWKIHQARCKPRVDREPCPECGR